MSTPVKIMEKEREEIVKIVNEVLGEDTFNVALDAVKQLANEYKAASRRSYEKSVIIEELQRRIDGIDTKAQRERLGWRPLSEWERAENLADNDGLGEPTCLMGKGRRSV